MTCNRSYVIIRGEHGDTGERQLKKSLTHRDKFERSKTDVFEIPEMDLGELKSLKIWHDNKGLGM